jgi:hypothetical protein
VKRLDDEVGFWLLIAFLILVVMTLSGCDKRISSEPVGVPVVAEKEVSCPNGGPGHCLGCGIGFDGKYDCTLKFKYNCPGKKLALVETQHYVDRYESGKEVIERRSRTLKDLGPCKR